MMTVGGRFERASLLCVPPIRAVSSLFTISITTMPGVKDFSTSCPIACSLTFAIKSLTTLKLTSASSSANRTSRSASPTSSSDSLPLLLSLPNTFCNRFANPSNAMRFTSCFYLWFQPIPTIVSKSSVTFLFSAGSQSVNPTSKS
ncbi:hypothetical protein D3C86_1470470 [compost metagenome]